MRLSGPQSLAFSKALRDAFNKSGLEQMVHFRLEEDLEDIVSLSQNKQVVVFELIKWAERRERVLDLLEGARASNPENGLLMMLGSELGFSSAGPDPEVFEEQRQGKDVTAKIQEWRMELESHVRDETEFIKPTEWLARWGALERQVCRVEVHGFTKAEYGTGFLVGPDLVLTNHHVVEQLRAETDPLPPTQVILRFDHRHKEDGMSLETGREFKLAGGDHWWVAGSPISASDDRVELSVPDDGSLDYALLRLSEPAGELAVGDNPEPGAKERGWIEVGTPPVLADKHIVSLLQHPSQKPLRLAFGAVIEVNSNGTRLRHNANTEPGSSGSPCFTADLALAALHHVGGPEPPGGLAKFNQAVPMDKIVADLHAQNITL